MASDDEAQVFGGEARGGRVLALLGCIVVLLSIIGFQINRAVDTPSLPPLVHNEASYPSEIPGLATRCPQPIPVLGSGVFQRGLEVKQSPDGSAIGYDPFSGQPIRRMTALEAHAAAQCPYVIDLYGQLPDKTLMLTFDDGPDPTWTPQVLSILQQFHVPATFFNIGNSIIANQDLFKRLTSLETVGNHTLHHPDLNTLSADEVRQEILQTDHVMAAVGQYQTKLFRQPSVGSDPDSLRANFQGILVAQQLGKVTVGFTIDPADYNPKYQKPGSVIPPPELTQSEAIVMHDGGGNRSAMVSYLIKVIQQAQVKGYHFITADQLLAQQHLLPTPAISHGKTIVDTIGYDRLWLQGSLLTQLASGVMRWCTIVIGCLTVGAVILALYGNWRIRRRYQKQSPWHPELVSVLIAAYNEEKTIRRTVDRIFQFDYPFNVQLVVVNDGSKDNTAGVLAELARQYCTEKKQLLVINQANTGKGGALNNPIQSRQIKGEVMVTIDADTLVDRHTIIKLVRHFEDDMVGAVAGRIKVLNYGKTPWSWLLATWQQAEYNLGIGLTRMAQATLDAIMIVPGACSAWRTRAITDELPGPGGFPLNTKAEDADLGMVLRWRGYKIVQDLEAVAYTEVPMTWKALRNQQLRWMFGIYQVLYKHSGIMRRPIRFGPLAYLVMPYALLGTLVPTLLLPINYLLCALALATGNWLAVVQIVVLFTGVRFVMSVVAMITLREWTLDPLTAVFYRFLNDPLQIYLTVVALYGIITGRAIIAWAGVGTQRYGDDAGGIVQLEGQAPAA